MRIFIKIGVLVFCIINTNVNAEGVADNLTVYQVRIDQNGMGYVHFTSALTGTPAACASTHSKQLSFDTNTAGGRAILSVALSAKMSGKKVYAKGTGSCEGYSVVERWSIGYIKD